MKLIIDIDEIEYNTRKIMGYFSDNSKILEAVANGTPIPDNATNGEIMQMIFPKGVTAKFATFMRFVVGEYEYINCAYDWWDAPYYQKGGKE